MSITALYCPPIPRDCSWQPREWEIGNRFGSRPPQQDQLFLALCDAADEFGYVLTDASIESWHAHWLVDHGFDSVPTMVGRLKNRMRQVLGVGRIWTEGYYDSRLFDVGAVQSRSRYIARHAGCRMTDGLIVKNPGKAGG